MGALRTLPSRAALMQAAAAAVAGALEAGLAARGQACAALSGGATPEPAYALLAEAPLDWRRVRFALVDERFVPPSHPASNEAMVRRALAPALAQGAQFEPMFSPSADLAAAADAADARYRRLRFDIALMGMGEDGHTASWFAGAEGLAQALDPASPRTVAALRAPQAPGSAARLSLTFAAVARAARVLLLIAGAEKRARFEAAVAAPEASPVGALLRLSALETLWAP